MHNTWAPAERGFTVSKPGKDGEIRCSFCGKDREAVNKLIAAPPAVAPSTYICDECVDLCDDIIYKEWEKENPDLTSSDEGQPILHSEMFCCLCRIPVAQGGFKMVFDRGPLCVACLDAIRAVTDNDDHGS